ncbi:hypothetical protein F0562_016048 [Nyssa sinensis]|uniref:Uncharacterized protein n=1 Tax=Nyssa sinensis TaxID=561372 RepID=A0A5J4ZLD6_9ASTE|nr:hypothetical protein F0562_016048 [Nyssa sinensis]
MGNCLVLQEKVIMVMKTDGKVLEYKAPMKAHQLLSEFDGHAISDTIPVVRHLQPDTELFGGHLYYLLPLPMPPPESCKKMLRFSNPLPETVQGTGVMRIKLVISKKELEVMLKTGVSIDDMVSQLQNKQSRSGTNKFDDDDNRKCKGWKPALESIPEMKGGESVTNYCVRTMGIANKMRFHGEKMEDVAIVEKILRSLAPKYDYVIRSIEESKDIDELSLDELQSSLFVHEQNMNQSSATDEQALKASTLT